MGKRKRARLEDISSSPLLEEGNNAVQNGKEEGEITVVPIGEKGATHVRNDVSEEGGGQKVGNMESGSKV